MSKAIVINLSESHCGACGAGMRIDAVRCENSIGWTPEPTCGTVFEYVTSDYVQITAEQLSEWRPDLTPFSVLDSLGADQ